MPPALATDRFPAASKTRPWGEGPPVAGPPRAAIGAALPDGLGAYSLIALTVDSDTHRSPLASTASPRGPFCPVSVPIRVGTPGPNLYSETVELKAAT